MPPTCHAAAPAAACACACAGESAASSPPLYAQLGRFTRQLHDALVQLGVMPQLQSAAADLPDVRSRLDYIAAKTGQAADKVLTLVDEAKAERRALALALRGLVDDAPSGSLPAGRLDAIEAHLERVDARLTDIMLAQDFHDPTGQVMRRVARLATEMEASLVTLLVQAAPLESDPGEPAAAASALQGPVVAPSPQQDVATSQGEVDELLASLGF